MNSLRIFTWWFLVGSLMAAAVILIQGGIRDIIVGGEPLWEVKLVELGTPILGGGLLGGCIALILNRIRKPDS